jgi:pimeloyl-ACP methyl ester carboxylesterase
VPQPVVTAPWRQIDGGAGPLGVYAAGPAADDEAPAVVCCHDLPRVRGGGAGIGNTFPALCDRLALESGVRVVTATLRGAGSSAGDFSVGGWLEDLGTVVAAEVGERAPVLLVGFGLGGALALALSAGSRQVRGVACLGTAADLAPWAARPGPLVELCRRSAVIHDARFPEDPVAWAAEMAGLRPLDAAGKLAGRPLLVVHGADDPDVPTAAARALVDAATGPTELRIVPGAGHWLRADPRVVAALIGWIERRR